MKNPKWHRDEIILALNLYFDKDRGTLNAHNPKIIELSTLLNDLPIVEYRPDKEKFRNPNGVTLKLTNFLSLDPAYKGVGMKSASKLDKEIFEEFYTNHKQMKIISDQIKRIANNDKLSDEIMKIKDEDIENTYNVKEGSVLYKYHKLRERDYNIIKRKKNLALSKYGKLECEVCIFNFERKYGKIASNFIECHHKAPLYLFENGITTKLDDLALVCPNCHRVLHRNISVLSVEKLKEIVQAHNI